MLPIIYIFIVLVLAYLVLDKIPKFDMITIIIALIVLVCTIIYKQFYQIKEHFEQEKSITLDLDKLKPIELEEDITSIKDRLVVYTTAFNKTSYNENSNSWLNMIIAKKELSNDYDNSVFNFELPPVYSRKSGFYLGNNRLIGPYSNALNIQFHNTFTFVIACKNGNLLVDDTNNEIEIFKLYANSPNNNGLCMYIQKGSLQNINNVQMGKLMFQYSNREPVQCKIRPDYDLISFEKDIYTFYFIIKDTDHIRVAVMNETNNTINEILRFNVENTDVTFSNKEFVMNRLKNWNGHLYGLALYNAALNDDNITSLYNHMLNEYIKYVNPNYLSMIQQYNDTISLLSQFTSCPYDKRVCDSCSTITKWNTMEQLVSASAQCRNAINDFCMANINHPLCKCWNSQNQSYNSDACKMYRGVFSNKNVLLDALNQDDIDYIMKKYKLIKPEDCPKSIKNPEYKKNSYKPYEFDKIQIRLNNNENNRSGTVKNVYGADPKALDPEDESYDWDKLKIKYDPNLKSDTDKKEDKTDIKINNYYKGVIQEYQQLVKKEQKNLNDTKDLNIFQNNDVDPIKIIPYYRNTKQETKQETKKVNQEQDPFYSRFMKVIL